MNYLNRFLKKSGVDKTQAAVDTIHIKTNGSATTTPRSVSPACSTSAHSNFGDTTTDEFESAEEGTPRKLSLTALAERLDHVHISTPQDVGDSKKPFVFPFSPVEDELLVEDDGRETPIFADTLDNLGVSMDQSAEVASLHNEPEFIQCPIQTNSISKSYAESSGNELDETVRFDSKETSSSSTSPHSQEPLNSGIPLLKVPSDIEILKEEVHIPPNTVNNANAELDLPKEPINDNKVDDIIVYQVETPILSGNEQNLDSAFSYDPERVLSSDQECIKVTQDNADSTANADIVVPPLVEITDEVTLDRVQPSNGQKSGESSMIQDTPNDSPVTRTSPSDRSLEVPNSTASQSLDPIEGQCLSFHAATSPGDPEQSTAVSPLNVTVVSKHSSHESQSPASAVTETSELSDLEDLDVVCKPESLDITQAPNATSSELMKSVVVPEQAFSPHAETYDKHSETSPADGLPNISLSVHEAEEGGQSSCPSVQAVLVDSAISDREPIKLDSSVSLNSAPQEIKTDLLSTSGLTEDAAIVDEGCNVEHSINTPVGEAPENSNISNTEVESGLDIEEGVCVSQDNIENLLSPAVAESVGVVYPSQHEEAVAVSLSESSNVSIAEARDEVVMELVGNVSKTITSTAAVIDLETKPSASSSLDVVDQLLQEVNGDFTSLPTDEACPPALLNGTKILTGDDIMVDDNTAARMGNGHLPQSSGVLNTTDDSSPATTEKPMESTLDLGKRVSLDSSASLNGTKTLTCDDIMDVDDNAARLGNGHSPQSSGILNTTDNSSPATTEKPMDSTFDLGNHVSPDSSTSLNGTKPLTCDDIAVRLGNGHLPQSSGVLNTTYDSSPTTIEKPAESTFDIHKQVPSGSLNEVGDERQAAEERSCNGTAPVSLASEPRRDTVDAKLDMSTFPTPGEGSRDPSVEEDYVVNLDSSQILSERLNKLIVEGDQLCAPTIPNTDVVSTSEKLAKAVTFEGCPPDVLEKYQISPKKPAPKKRFSMPVTNCLNSTNSTLDTIESSATDSKVENTPMNTSYTIAREPQRRPRSSLMDFAKGPQMSQILATCSKQEDELLTDTFCCIQEEATRIAKELKDNKVETNNSSSEAAGEENDEFEKEENFQSVSDFDFEFLSKVGGKSKFATNLARKSLYVKFDPLVEKVLASSDDPESELVMGFAAKHSVSAENKAEDASTSDGSEAKVESEAQEDERLIPITPLAPKRTKQVSQTPSLRQEITRLQDMMLQQEADHQEKEDLVEQLRLRIRALEAGQADAERTVSSAELDERDRKIAALQKEIVESRSSNKQLVQVMEEYEKTISKLVAIKEEITEDYEREKAVIIAERDEALKHLANMELTFNDIHQKYERAKDVITTFHANELTLKKNCDMLMETVKKQKEGYFKFKQHAAETLQNANEQIELKEREIARMKVVLKKDELKSKSLQESIAQKDKEILELTSICDELIAKS